MRTLARNTLLPLLLVGPLLAWVIFMALDTTREYPQALLLSALIPGALCLVSLGLMILTLYKLPRREAFIGALTGSVIGVFLAFGGGTFGMMMLAFSGDSGMQAAAQALPITLSLTALLILAPLVLGLFLGARVGQSSSRPARPGLPGGPA